MFSEAEKEHALQLFVDMIKFKVIFVLFVLEIELLHLLLSIQTISGEAPQTGLCNYNTTTIRLTPKCI